MKERRGDKSGNTGLSPGAPTPGTSPFNTCPDPWTHEANTPTHLVQLPGHVSVLLIHEGQGVTHVSHATGSPDAVHVVVDVRRKVVVDHLKTRAIKDENDETEFGAQYMGGSRGGETPGIGVGWDGAGWGEARAGLGGGGARDMRRSW